MGARDLETYCGRRRSGGDEALRPAWAIGLAWTRLGPRRVWPQAAGAALVPVTGHGESVRFCPACGCPRAGYESCMVRSLSWRESRALGMFVRRYPHVHLGIGLVGNGVFFLGTILFMFKKYEEAGLWFFLVGTAGMFLGSVGEILRVKGKR